MPKSKQIVVRVPLEVLKAIQAKRDSLAKLMPGTKVSLSAAVKALIIEASHKKK